MNTEEQKNENLALKNERIKMTNTLLKYTIRGIRIFVALIVIGIIVLIVQNKTPKELKLKSAGTPCAGNISDLDIIQTTYKTYDLDNYDTMINYDEMNNQEDAVEPQVLIKNNSSCIATSINLEVDIKSNNNPDIKQDQTFVLSALDGGLLPQQTKEYSVVFDAFDSFINKQSDYGGTVTRSTLSSDANITTKIISADWSGSNN